MSIKVNGGGIGVDLTPKLDGAELMGIVIPSDEFIEKITAEG